MSPGVLMLTAILVAFGAVLGLNLWMAQQSRRAEGSDAPDLPGELGEAVKGDVLLWFHSPTCAPCKSMEPAVRALGDRVRAVDVSHDLGVAQAFGVMGTPTTIRIRDGRIEAVRLGMLSSKALDELAA